VISAEDPAAQRVGATLRTLQAASSMPLAAYWLTMNGERTPFQSELQELVRGDGLVVLIVRQERFDNPNALMQDLLELMENNKDVLLREASVLAAGDGGRLGLVLLSRRELMLGQGYSPITWPRWVPGAGGREVICYITDVTRRILAPLNCAESQVWRLNTGLLALEEALIRRLIAVYERDARAGEAFFDRIKRRNDPPWLGFLEAARLTAAKVKNDTGFRPDAAASLVTRLWRAAQSLCADDARDLAASLSLALALNDRNLSYRDAGLLTILSRPDGSKNAPAELFTRDVVFAVNLAAQYVTCVAHGGEYRQYPIHLMTSVVEDLHGVLTELETALNRIEDEPPVSHRDRDRQEQG
jgi:hypothetical protein